MAGRSDTKYGDRLADHEWSTPDQGEPDQDRTRVKNHELDVIYTTDPGETGGYGREKYTAYIRYDEESGEPYVLYVVEHRWKGNYWRDVTDWDWRDVPQPVRERVAAVLPVETPGDLDSGTRLMDEGGESRWEKHHRKRMESLSGDEMWGTSFLRDAVNDLERAAESFVDGSKAESWTERLVTLVQRVVKRVERRDEEGSA